MLFADERVSFSDAEQVDSHGSCQEVLVCGDDLGSIAEPGDAGVGTGEQVIVDTERARVSERFGSEVVRSDRGHVAAVAVGFGLGRVIEARGTVSES